MNGTAVKAPGTLDGERTADISPGGQHRLNGSTGQRFGRQTVSVMEKKKHTNTHHGPYAYDLERADIRRERQKARDLRQSQWWKRRLAKGICQYCGRPTPPDELTMDHIVPVARGGRTTRGNVVTVCKICNNKKKQLLPTEWAAYLEELRKSVDDPPQ